ESLRVPENNLKEISIDLHVATQPTDCGMGKSSATYEQGQGKPALVGLVRGESGRPLARFKVRLAKVNGPQARTSQWSNENGEFQFEDVKPGQYFVRASHKTYWNVGSEIFWITRENVTRVALTAARREKGKNIILCQ